MYIMIYIYMYSWYQPVGNACIEVNKLNVFQNHFEEDMLAQKWHSIDSD